MTDGGGPVVINCSIDRIDRLPSGGIEVIDHKTGRVSSQKVVDESLYGGDFERLVRVETWP